MTTKLVDGVRIDLTPEEEAAKAASVELELAKMPARYAQAEIERLEALETPRRLAESVLTDEGKAWLSANRDLIATERGKL